MVDRELDQRQTFEGSKKTIRKFRVPKVSMPRIASGTRNPAGWGSTEINIRGRGMRGAATFKRPDPAGPIPPEMQAQYPSMTQPEWSIWWAFLRRGMKPGEDFSYAARVGGVEASYYSQIDFYVPTYFVGIEVQGKYWHLGQGSEKVLTDIMRVNNFQMQGITVIFIDEEHANSDPEYYLDEALQKNDHSHVATGRRAYT